jgi:hypothetical protein
MGCCQSKREEEHELKADRENHSNLNYSSDNDKVRGAQQLDIIHINKPVDIATTRRLVEDTNRTLDVPSKKEEDNHKLSIDDDGVKPRKRAKSKIAITVAESEPQNLNPNNVYFIENKNVSPIKLKQEPEPVKQEVIHRQTTMDKILEEKIRNKANFEDLLKDGRLGELMK